MVSYIVQERDLGCPKRCSDLETRHTIEGARRQLGMELHARTFTHVKYVPNLWEVSVYENRH